MNSLYERLYGQRGPRAFRKVDLDRAEDLFADRGALFFTPTEYIPQTWVGQGSLHVHLPIVTPTYDEMLELRAYMSPRFWVDLLQRHTGKLRWTPVELAAVTFHRFDVRLHRDDIVIAGVKALLDSLKVKTTGRRDGRYLHYFGAIRDDSSRHLANLSIKQTIVSTAAEAAVEVSVCGVEV